MLVRFIAARFNECRKTGGFYEVMEKRDEYEEFGDLIAEIHLA